MFDNSFRAIGAKRNEATRNTTVLFRAIYRRLIKTKVKSLGIAQAATKLA